MAGQWGTGWGGQWGTPAGCAAAGGVLPKAPRDRGLAGLGQAEACHPRTAVALGQVLPLPRPTTGWGHNSGAPCPQVQVRKRVGLPTLSMGVGAQQRSRVTACIFGLYRENAADFVTLGGSGEVNALGKLALAASQGVTWPVSCHPGPT